MQGSPQKSDCVYSFAIVSVKEKLWHLLLLIIVAVFFLMGQNYFAPTTFVVEIQET